MGLSTQYPEAIGGVDTQQGSIQGTVVAFDSSEARDKARSIDIRIQPLAVIGTPTLSSDSSVLDKLPILRPSDFSPLLQKVFNKYGKVLHIGLYVDPQTKLFFGKGYIMLDTACDSNQGFQKLTHEIPLDNQRIILVIWRDKSKILALAKVHEPTEMVAPPISKYSNMDLVTTSIRESTNSKTNDSLSDLISDDSDDESYEPSSESDMSDEESYKDSATDDMLIDPEEIKQLQNDTQILSSQTQVVHKEFYVSLS